MSDISDKGSIFDKILGEEWFSTPDMGEYMDNRIFKTNSEGMSEEKKNVEFYVENPPVVSPGYHKDLGVVAITCNPSSVHKNSLSDKATKYGWYDGDTIKLKLGDIYDTDEPFQVYYSDYVFNGVKHYIKESCNLNAEYDTMDLRFVGLDAPEVVHYGDFVASLKGEDIYTTTWGKINTNNAYVTTDKGQVLKEKCVYKNFKTNSKGEYLERDANETIKFLRIYKTKALYPSIKKDEMETFHEIVEDLSSGSSGRKEKRCVLNYAGNDKAVEYARQANIAKKVVRDAIKGASEMIVLLDTNGINGKKAGIPEEYKKSYEKSTYNPFYALYDMWNNILGKKAAYLYSNFNVPGQELNGRFLGAIYVKIRHNGVDQWINLNKKVLFECDMAKARPAYSSSPDSIVNNNYLAPGFKLWTFDKDKQLYVDSISEEVLRTKDDREEIQMGITGCNLKELSEHTVMIGDTLFMIPPTSIRSVTQTKTAKVHLIRAKGAAAKSLPKTERIIELELYFNRDEGINGIPVTRKLPNGMDKVYFMNGLRGLIAQFKLTPFLPIHNKYVNEVLNIEAVALAGYTVSTVPNFPRTLQVTLTMYEFDWTQYMPTQAMPDLSDENTLYKNGFSDTIYFPILRFYYQKALERGQELKTGVLADFNPNDPAYIKATIGNRTALQPMDFKEPLMDVYVPNDQFLKLKKQLKIEMKTRPLGQKYTFSEVENKWIESMHYVNKLVSASSEALKFIQGLTDAPNGLKVVLKSGNKTKGTYNDVLNGVGNFVVYKDGIKVVKDVKELGVQYLTPIFKDTLKAFNEQRENIRNIITSFDIETELINENGNFAISSKKPMYLKISTVFTINEAYFEDTSSLDKIRSFIAKNNSITKESVFRDNKIRISYVAEFDSKLDLKKGLTFLSPNHDIIATDYLASFSNSKFEDGTDDFDINKEIENLKDSIDIESEDSIKFDKFDIGKPIITRMQSSFNNIFANMSLKAIDGHASQYTGGTDSTIDVEMVADEYTVGQLNFLTRLSVKNLIDYRKVMTSSPVRIDSDFTRLLGIYEVIIDNIDINTIESQPGYFNIKMRISSVDRTLRNRESLRKIKGLDNSSTQKDTLINTKNFFDFKNVLGKAEIYPDLELPTIRELEEAGFYFLSSKYQEERYYPDPDFYFIYWYPTFSEMLKTSISEFFSDPQNMKMTYAGDLFKDSFDLNIPIGTENGERLYTVENYKEDLNQSHDKMVESLRELAKSIKFNGKEEKLLSESQQKKFVDMTTRRLDKIEKTNAVMNKLTESIEDATYGTSQVNRDINVSVKDIDMLDVDSDSTKKEIKTKSDKVKEVVKEALKIKPARGDAYTGSIILDIFGSTLNRERNLLMPGEENALGADNEVIQKISDTIFGKGVLKTNKKCVFTIATCIKAAAAGYLGKQGVFSASKKDYEETSKRENVPCLPPKYYEITDANGKAKKAPICLYEEPNISELAVAYNEETARKSIVFGRFAIKKYDRIQLGEIFGVPFKKDGFLDPLINEEIHELMYKEKITVTQKEIDEYLDGVVNNLSFAASCHFRQMLVWLYVLIEKGDLINICHVNFAKLMEAQEKGDKWLDKNMVEELSKSLFEDKEDHYDAPGPFETATNAMQNSKYKDEFDQLLGEGAWDKSKEDLNNAEDRIREIIKTIEENGEQYCESLLNGIFFTLSAVAMSGLESSVLSAVSGGDLTRYNQLVENGLGTTIYNNLSEEQKRFSRFVQYVNFTIEEDERYERNPIQNFSYNNKIQRAFLAAANDPRVYMLHSYYDMVTNDKRGTMARAFPTFYMLLIDEGRQIGLWKLQDNFYHMNSISSFEVVKSRKIAADTARITMTNMYGVFNSDDEDMKDENVYTMRDVWDSVFSPRKYFNEEYKRRSNAREINSAKMQPGARVHLRMGYSSNAANLPIVFNGTVAEFENGETMTLICQGDGVELANPHMFNPVDGDVQNIAYRDWFFGAKHIMEAWNNLSTPRDMLVLPLAAEGTFIEEQVRKYTHGRFFNSNPFGIVHFGDRNFKTIFTANGEVEQNIYEGLSKPTWNYEKSGIETVDDGLDKEYRMSEAPRVRVELSQGFSYWDLMHIASSLSPDFISAVAPFQLRSTIFHGHPRFYYAYDYIKKDSKIIEKRKPFQQYHIYTSYSDIVDNKITTSRKDIRTCIVGHYTGPGWLAKKPKTVGPLFVDIDIFPENQQSTSVNLNFEYKNNEILPFNIPVVDKAIDDFDWTDGPNGEKTAWRATASALKDAMKEMYKGELLIVGDPTVKPYDKVCINDVYEDIGGTCEVESVVHMFNTENGFVSSITPDLVSAIDNHYETVNNAFVSNVFLPAVVAELSMIGFVINFNAKNRAAYLSLSRAVKKGGNFVNDAVNTALTVVGKETIQREAALISSTMPDSLKNFLNLSDIDIKVYDKAKELLRGKSFIVKDINGPKSFSKLLTSFDELDDIAKGVNMKNLNDLSSMLSDSRYADTGAKAMLGNLNNDNDFVKAVTGFNNSIVFDANDLNSLRKGLESIGADDELVKGALKIIDGKNELNLTSKEGKAFINSLKKIGDGAVDFTQGGFDDIAKVLVKKGKTIKNSLKALDSVDDILKVAVKGAKGASSLLAAFNPVTLITLVAEIALTKSAQNYITNKLRNMQVLTLYPLKKDNKVWTAGIEGHQGSVFGSPAYDEPGFLEEMAIRFFDYGKDAPFWSGANALAFLRDFFITTPEMREIVDGYKRGNDYRTENQSPDKITTEAQNHVLDSTAKYITQSYSDYKSVYMTKRLTMGQIKEKDQEARMSYAKYRIRGVENIEQTSSISTNLKNIIYGDKTGIMKRLYDAGGLRLSYDHEITDEQGMKNIKMKKVKIPMDGTSKTEEAWVKEIGTSTPAVYDIPYLREDALMVLTHFVTATLKEIQKDYDLPDSKFEYIKNNPIVFHSGTRVNSSEGWRATGYVFTVEVKNYPNISNIIKEMEANRNQIAKDSGVEIPFTIKSESATEFGPNAYSFFIHCPIV